MNAPIVDIWGGRLLAWWYSRKLLPVHWQNSGAVPSHHTWGIMLQRWVDDNGMVDYRGWRNHAADLAAYLHHLSKHPPAANWSREEIISYWINAYNALTLQLILQHPEATSIRQISSGAWWRPTAFDRNVWQLCGKPLSLNDIEHRLLRPLGQPAIHMAINCASASCPVLRNEAYVADNLHQQLTSQVHRFLQDTARNRPEEGLLSPIFAWFSSDFGGEKGVRTWIQQQTGQSLPHIDYLSYDWSLNESKQHETDSVDSAQQPE